MEMTNGDYAIIITTFIIVIICIIIGWNMIQSSLRTKNEDERIARLLEKAIRRKYK